MKKTLISHFYNEEYLLPWFLKHHRQVFDHGIMIDYASTDRSREIIRELCPSWEIVASRNQWFDPGPVDEEVMDIERNLEGWRVCLNVTEQIVGDWSVLDTTEENQLLMPALYFVDRQLDEVSSDKPLYEQKFDGFAWTDPEPDHGGDCFRWRQARSIHRVPVKYPGQGRHYTSYNTDQLAIFYYGWCPLNETAVGRKLGIGDKVPDWIQAGRHHTLGIEWMNDAYENVYLKRTRDLTADMQRYIQDHNRYVDAKC